MNSHMPVELRIGDQVAEVAHLEIASNPEVWRPRLADLLRQVADEIESPTGNDQEETPDEQHEPSPDW